MFLLYQMRARKSNIISSILKKISAIEERLFPEGLTIVAVCDIIECNPLGYDEEQRRSLDKWTKERRGCLVLR